MSPLEPLLNRQITERLVCPVTKGPLRFDAEQGELVSVAAGLAFSISEGVPLMHSSQARDLSEEEKKRWRR